MAFEVEQLFGAIDIILNQRLQDVNFDKTIICTIVDDSDKKNGCYVVSDGTIKFKAYVSDATYKNDDQVRVSVLGGDFSEKKFITGRYTGNEDSSPITYKSPLESIIPITGNLVDKTVGSDRNGVNGMRANSDIIQKELWRIDLTSNTEFRDLQSNGIYNTLTIKADFKTLLSHYDLVSGNYGLRLDLLIQPSFDNPTQRIRRWVTLDSSEMMGNPYSFSIYSTQAKKVDIVSTGVIAEMVLWMYQSINGDGEGRRFIDKNGNEIPVNQKADDILVKNIEIGFGSDIEKISDNTLEIFSSSPPYYVYKDATEITNKKEIELLWYNKTENNEYVGFSDGLFDLDYDEIDYLEKSNQDSRLLAQIGRTDIPSDENGLKLAADLKDAKPIMIKARDALTKDVADVLYDLQRQVKGTNAILAELDKLLDTVNGGLVQQWQKANSAIENWNTSYVGVLQYAYDIQNAVETPSEWKADWEKDWISSEDVANPGFMKSVKDGVKLVRDFFIWFDGITQPSAAQSGHRGNYDLYQYRMEIELELIEDWLDQLDSLLKDNYAKLIAYKTKKKDQFIEYKTKDFSAYANKYCVYWYRYEKGYKLEYQKDATDNNKEFNFGKFMTDGWRRLTDLPKNFGLPRDEKLCVTEDGEPYYDKNGNVIDANKKKYYSAKALGQVVSRMMDRNLTEEKYAVVLFHNHEMYKSNIITFTNSEPELIPNDALIDKKDALKIEHDVASQEHYQSYNEFNQLRSLDDGGRIRQLKCSYDGLFKGDEALINAGIYWYIPTHNTMLTFDEEDLIKEGFSTDAKERTARSLNGYTYFYKKINIGDTKIDEVTPEEGDPYYVGKTADRLFYYKIKPYLEKDATNNTIKVKAYLEGIEEPVEGEITMTFSTFGSNGTKYTLSVVPSGSQVSVMENSPLQLSVMLRDYQNKPINIYDIDNMSANGDGAYGFIVENWSNSPNAFDITYLPVNRGKTDPITGLKVTLGSKKDSWPTDTPYFGIINAKVTYTIKNEQTEESEEEKLEAYDKSKTVDLNTLYAITYSANNNYYMSGATSIVYNNQGTISYISEDEYLLYTVNQKGNTPVPNQVWSLEYYDNKGNYIAPGTSTYEMLRNYMPVLMQGENRLVPAPLYIENLNYVPVVICTVNGDFAWAQPIIITQNCYASPVLDAWNGSLTIDEKNGTILSTAVGAGKKETDNSFSGVLMGDIGKGLQFDTDNMSGLGLYGFNFGAQSFCLSVDGTAFFGKAGRGRIHIDGDSGTIASASYEQVRRNGAYPTSAGMLIDLDDGFIHMLGVRRNGADYYPDHPEASSQAEIMLSTTGLLDGIEDAYFKIRSRKQTDLNHYLMFVGSDTYYLQTDDYTAWEYTKSDSSGELDFSGKGLRLDLKDGKLDSYNFQLSSKNVYIDSTDSSEGFFIIKDNAGVNLFFAGRNDYYLKSSDYQTMNDNSLGTGMKLTLMTTTGNTGIEAYNFDLRAGNTGYGDHEIVLSDSGDPYFMVNTAYNNTTKTLVHISKTEQSFQSSDYDATNKQGIRLSLSGKELKAYSGFTLQAYKPGTSQYILLDATASDYPLKVYGSADKYFQVNWNGGLEATGAEIKGIINATGGTFTGTVKVEGVFSGGTIKGATIKGGTLDIGSGAAEGAVGSAPFHVNADGSFVATSGTIGGWNVSSGGSGGGAAGFSYPGVGSMLNTGLTFGDKFYVDAEGNLFATSATFDTSLTVTSSRGGGEVLKVDSSGNILLDGNITLGTSQFLYLTDSKSDYIYSTGGWLFLNADKVTVGAIDSNVTIQNNVEIKGDLTVKANTTVKKDITYEGKINTSDGGTTQSGVNGTITYVSGGIWGGAKKTAKFVKGILVSADDIDSGAADTGNYTLPTISSGQAGYTLKVNSSGSNVEWVNVFAPTSRGGENSVWAGKGTTTDPGWKTIYPPTSYGTAGYVWTSNGSGTVPSWQAAKSYTFEGAGATTVTVNGNKVTISSTDTDTHPTSCYAIFGSVNAGQYVCTRAAANYGSIQRCSFTGSSVTTSSALRFKNTINDLNLENNIIMKLRPVSYYYNKDTGYGDNLRYGFIAEEVMEFAPELIEMDPEDNSLCNSIYYNSIISLAVAEIQKLRKELDELKSNFNI